jgi:hypothetical protein
MHMFRYCISLLLLLNFTESSPWSSQVVMVQKKDGSWRMCVDYRKLNEKTIKDAYPLTRIDENLDTLEGASSWKN